MTGSVRTSHFDSFSPHLQGAADEDRRLSLHPAGNRLQVCESLFRAALTHALLPPGAAAVKTVLSRLACRGLHPVSDEEVIAMYEGSHVPLEIMSDFYGKVTAARSLSRSLAVFSFCETSVETRLSAVCPSCRAHTATP